MAIDVKYRYVMGIELGDLFSSVSVAHVKDPANIYSVESWDNEQEAWTNRHYRFPTSIRYNNDWMGTKSLGVEYDTNNMDDHGSTSIYQIKQYLFHPDKSNEILGKMKKGLTIKKVLADFLAGFVQLARRRFRVHEQFQKSQFYDNDLKAKYIHYRVACPSSLQGLMRECFVYAGITDNYKLEQQLSFVTEVEAIAYHQIALDRKITGLKIDQSYLICSVSENSVGIADICVDTTEALSTVELVGENLKGGSTALENRFRDYLEERCIWFNQSPETIEKACSDFLDTMKFGFKVIDPNACAFELQDVNKNTVHISYENLDRAVFLPYIDTIIQCILDIYKKLKGNRQLLLSGKYGQDPYFIKHLVYDIDETCLQRVDLVKNLFDSISSGAVTSALRKSEVRTPLFHSHSNDLVEEDYYADRRTDNIEEDYDFIVGLGKVYFFFDIVSSVDLTFK
ncbi:uncharacterized protein EV154DRAFT_523004 [Mucor mucedo]|uniref:uncharacterized protein n=1 Tax=Mucor mucedo TaxID=29922 RepID=UPI00221FD3D1|nr:uncharacterized protein EV154DRAFT_523004 [Mucor mucedo]KAI7882305.1 hypothetical protein EV154DRAFT_523004 [Mucor mucedo]